MTPWAYRALLYYSMYKIDIHFLSIFIFFLSSAARTGYSDYDTII